jgi:ribosomal protein L37AE/L43A
MEQPAYRMMFGSKIPAKGYRYCEHCKEYKPAGKRPARKGWRCAECRDALAKASEPTSA